MHSNFVASRQRQLCWHRQEWTWLALMGRIWFLFRNTWNSAFCIRMHFWNLKQCPTTSTLIQSYLWSMRFRRRISFLSQEDFQFNSIAMTLPRFSDKAITDKRDDGTLQGINKLRSLNRDSFRRLSWKFSQGIIVKCDFMALFALEAVYSNLKTLESYWRACIVGNFI